jgi:hypothetical protein
VDHATEQRDTSHYPAHGFTDAPDQRDNNGDVIKAVLKGPHRYLDRSRLDHRAPYLQQVSSDRTFPALAEKIFLGLD